MNLGKLLLAGLLLLAVMLGIHVSLIDGLDGVISPAVLTEDTQYAPGYSNAAWRKVTEGASEGDVVALLGQPIAKMELGGVIAWNYSRSPGDHSYRIRSVHFQAGKVVAVRSLLYSD